MQGDDMGYPGSNFTERVQYFFANVPVDGRLLTDAEISRRAEQHGGQLSRQQVGLLRKGESRNPKLETIRVLAAIWGVPASAFTEFPDDPQVDAGIDPAKRTALGVLYRNASDLGANEINVLNALSEKLRALNDAHGGQHPPAATE